MKNEMIPMIMRGVITEVGGAVDGTTEKNYDLRYTVESLDYPSTSTRSKAACAIPWTTEVNANDDAVYAKYKTGEKVFFVLFPDGSGLILRHWYPETYVAGGGE